MCQEVKRGRGQPRKAEKRQLGLRAEKSLASKFLQTAKRLNLKQVDAFEEALKLWLEKVNQ